MLAITAALSPFSLVAFILGWITTVTLIGVVGGLTQTWPVMIAAATQLVRLDLGTATTILWMFAFALATTTGIVVLEILAIRSPGSAADRLNRIRSYVDDHRDSVLNWVYLVGGLWLAIKAAIGLISR